MELKSGALFSLALLIGAVVGGASQKLIETLDLFGHGFGLGLQMFDDLGNLKGSLEPTKRWEDLILRRPTWVWASAAKYYSQEAYGEFVLAVHQLPHDCHPLETWFDEHDFLKKSKRLAHEHIKHCFTQLEYSIPNKDATFGALTRLRELGMEISRAYD
jgi:geranylgeranyl pyrophosphate synthase